MQCSNKTEFIYNSHVKPDCFVNNAANRAVCQQSKAWSHAKTVSKHGFSHATAISSQKA